MKCKMNELKKGDFFKYYDTDTSFYFVTNSIRKRKSGMADFNYYNLTLFKKEKTCLPIDYFEREVIKLDVKITIGENNE